jgi:hypothetical protein
MVKLLAEIIKRDGRPPGKPPLREQLDALRLIALSQSEMR